jgi:hypothetical protein
MAASVRWLLEDLFGMFIYWGLYCPLAQASG